MSRNEKMNWKELLKINFIVLRLTGLWPKENTKYGFNFYTLYVGILAVFFLTIHNICTACGLVKIYTDVNAFWKGIFAFPLEVLIVGKLYYFAKNVIYTRQLFETLENDIFYPKNEAQYQLIEPGIKQWKKFNSVFYVAVCLADCLLYSIYPIIDNYFFKIRTLPFEVDYPFESRKDPYYMIVYCYQAITAIELITVSVSINTFCAAIMAILAAQCELLCDNLKNINSTNFYPEFVRCVHHHQMIIKMSANFRKGFNFVFLGQLLGSLTSLGLAMFYLTLVTPNSGEFFQVVFFIFSVVMEIFTYCWFGQRLKNKSGQIAYSAFASDWINLSKKDKKCLCIFIMNAQNPIAISAMNLFQFSLPTFSYILRTAWSYFAVLRRVNMKT